MSAPKRTILVTGATGKQGGSLIRSLSSDADSPFNVIAVTRDPLSHGAQRLANNPNVSVIQGNLSDPYAIFGRAGPNIWGVFSVQVNSDAEEAEGKGLIDAAIKNGVKYFVYSSGDRGGPEKSPHNPTFVKNFAAKYAIEKYLEQKGEEAKMQFTILRPVTFFENITPDMHGKGFVRMWEQMHRHDKALSFVSTHDIGTFAALAFRNPVEWAGKAPTLVGDKLTQEQGDRIFQEVTGKPMAMQPCLMGSVVKWALRDTVGDMFRWFETEGYGGSVEECRRVVPGMYDFKTWLREESRGFVKGTM